MARSGYQRSRRGPSHRQLRRQRARFVAERRGYGSASPTNGTLSALREAEDLAGIDEEVNWALYDRTLYDEEDL